MNNEIQTNKLHTSHNQRLHIQGGIKMTFDEFKSNVEQWAALRGIYRHSTPEAQLLKAMSELGELADAHIKQDAPDKADGLIDTIVCLINYAYMEGIDMEKSMDDVWKILRVRQGRMVKGGAFVKDD